MRYLLAAVLALASSGGPAAGQQTLLAVDRVQWIGAGGTPSENCAGLRATLAGLGTTSETQSHLLRLEGGRYDCGADTVSVPSFVQIVGAGRGNTLITGNLDDDLLGVVSFDIATNSGLRALTVKHLGGTVDAVAVSALRANVRLEDVAIQADSTSNLSCALLVIGQVTDSDVILRDSTATGETDAVTTLEVQSGNASALVVSSELAGGTNDSGGGSIKCVESYDENLTLLTTSCAVPP